MYAANLRGTMTAIDRRDPQGHPVPLPESARTITLQATATEVPAHRCPAPCDLLGLHLSIRIAAAVALFAVAWTLGMATGTDVISHDISRGVDYWSGLQRSLMDPAAVFRGPVLSLLVLGGLVATHHILRRRAVR